MYKVLAAMRTDMNEGLVWLTKENYTPRSVIKIKNKRNNKVVYCEYLEIDQNFVNDYNQAQRAKIDPNEKSIVINGWYRKRLGGIATKAIHDIQITPANYLWGKFRACIGHPQMVVRLATWLAVISVVLGVLSIFLAFKKELTDLVIWILK